MRKTLAHRLARQAAIRARTEGDFVSVHDSVHRIRGWAYPDGSFKAPVTSCWADALRILARRPETTRRERVQVLRECRLIDMEFGRPRLP